MNRRDMLLGTGAVVGMSAFPLGWASAAEKKKQKVLFFTRSAGFHHSVVNRKNGQPAFAEKILTEMGSKAGFEVVCSQEEEVFDGDLDQYDVIAFYTTGIVISPQRKAKMLKAIDDGKGFVGFHCATDTFHAAETDPYIKMIGGEFIIHGAQQKATMKVVSPDFPGAKGLGDSFAMNEEWYSLYRFAPNLHVILLQETEGMKGPMYDRAPYPATWARTHGKGRVFYTSMGHREDVWTNPIFQQIVLGGFAWALRNIEADVTPNLDAVAPKANDFKFDKKKPTAKKA